MRTSEREVGQLVVESGGFPRYGRVTNCAVVVELALGVIRVGRVVVIGQMAGIAIGRQSVELPRRMAGGTGRRLMRSGQRIVG